MSAFESLFGGQFTLSTQLIKPNYLVQPFNVFNNIFNRELGESIQAMCRYAARNHHNLNSWLFAVPLAHFLTQESEPFNAAVLLLEQPQDRGYTWWGGSGFETKVVRERTVVDDGYGRIIPCKVDIHAIVHFIIW